ncbi:MAG: hypothetical protein F6K42_05445 [Leptolyngbya sp. SIO1D8]|nr:hypothetical protein [Leptolyngbya sp. SIO1D8]
MLENNLEIPTIPFEQSIPDDVSERFWERTNQHFLSAVEQNYSRSADDLCPRLLTFDGYLPIYEDSLMDLRDMKRIYVNDKYEDDEYLATSDAVSGISHNWEMFQDMKQAFFKSVWPVLLEDARDFMESDAAPDATHVTAEDLAADYLRQYCGGVFPIDVKPDPDAQPTRLFQKTVRSRFM